MGERDIPFAYILVSAIQFLAFIFTALKQSIDTIYVFEFSKNVREMEEILQQTEKSQETLERKETGILNPPVLTQFCTVIVLKIN